MIKPFSYPEAFSRNIGWVTREEQEKLRGARVAIAGMGGVGGIYAVTLARLGVGKFHLADFDTYDIANFNRQVGAMMSTRGKAKVEVIADMVRDINPEAEITIFPHGVDAASLPAFLDGVDLYVDGLDFFVFDIRQKTFAACAERGVPSTTVAPLGMGAAVLNFLPGQMTFEEYFQWGDRPENEKAIRFLVGLSPAGLHRSYLVDPSAVNFAERATQARKILLKRGKVLAAPHALQFDPFRNTMAHTWRPGGNKNPIQRIAIELGRRHLDKLLRASN